jgi:hypothetical protein
VSSPEQSDPPPEPWASAGRWFDGAWYLLRNPDVARAGIAPLAHYLRYGETEGRFPSRWFDPLWYRLTHGIPAGQSPLAHFVGHGRDGAFLPHAALYPVTRLPRWRAHDHPFDRYLDAMERPDHELLPDLDIIAMSGLIAPNYHALNGVGGPQAELDPVLHYGRFGWHLGRRPDQAFDPTWYAETNAAVAHARINPLTHYILEGEAAGRRPIPWFDPVWYRTRHEIPAGQTALAHYLAHRHGRAVSPNPLFDPAWYVARHDAAIPNDIDPFSHYLVHGAIADVDPSPAFDARLWRHRHMAPLGAPGQDRLPIQARNPLVHFLRYHLARS